jgi:hypothetical protein
VAQLSNSVSVHSSFLIISTLHVLVNATTSQVDIAQEAVKSFSRAVAQPHQAA